ncbi:hypothetical protein JCM10207_009276 [Rhodosporidiobolus poonsookiae]
MTSSAWQSEHMLTAIDYVFDFDELLCAPVPSASQPPIHTFELPGGATLALNRAPLNYNNVTHATKLVWTASANCPQLATNALSFTELFFLSPDNKPTLIEATRSDFQQSWPSANSSNIHIVVTRSAINAAELRSARKFTFASHTRYRARLSFLQHDKNSDRSAMSSDASPNDQLQGIRTLSSNSRALFDTPTPFDVQLTFPGIARKLWVPARFLQSSSPFFADLFASSSFRDSSKRTLSEHASSGVLAATSKQFLPPDELNEDKSTDDFSRRFSLPEQTPPSLRYYHVHLTSGSYSAYRALLTYRATRHISFRPLNQPATVEYLAAEHAARPDLPLPVSPKSMYRLAHFLGIRPLAALALRAYSPQLNASNIGAELFAPDWADTYDDVREAVFDVALQHKTAVRDSREFERALESLKAGELEAAACAVVAELLPRLLVD